MIKQKLLHALSRVAACLLLSAFLLAVLASCGEGYYKEVKSSEKEARVIAELGDYDVRYELFYAFFHAERAMLDGGDDSVWSGEGSEELWESIRTTVMSDITEIYATFAVCKKYGIDPYGDGVDEEVNKRVKIDIDGGILGETNVEGYGSKDAYLEALSAMKLNDSVNRLLHRYDICTELLYDEMIENYSGGDNTLTDAELEEFFLSDECVRINWVFRSHDNEIALGKEGNERLLNSAMEALKSAGSYWDVESAVVKYSMPSPTSDEIENGFYISRYSGFGSGQRAVIEAAFSLGAWDVSERIETSDGVYIVIALPKHSVTSSYFESHREVLYDLCLENRLWREISEKKNEMLEYAVFTELYGTLTPADLLSTKN